MIGVVSVASVEQITSNGHAGVSISGSAAANTLNLSAVTLNGITLVDGSGGNDNITGSAGADTIRGGANNDTLNGGPGDDIFSYTAGFGSDTVNGFDADPAGGQDKVDLTALGVTAATFPTAVGRTQVGANVRVTVAGGTITLAGQTLANVTVTDFVVN